MMLLLSRIIDFIEQTLIALYDHDSLVVDWFKEHATLIRVSRIITRFLIGHLCQNIALIVNTERWLVILYQGNKRAFKISICIFILNAVFLSAISLAKWSYFNLLMAFD